VKSVLPLSDGVPETVEKRWVRDLDGVYFPENPIVPFLNVVHDRITLEIFRGCTRGCRFCQAGFVYRPLREKTPETLMDNAVNVARNTGWEEISLCSLSSGDYTHITELIRDLIQKLEQKRVSVSLPSLRVDSFSKDYAGYMNKVRKTGLTFAPEAGTQRMRDIINKNVTEADLLNSVTHAFKAGYRSVKLYFMIGLPEETADDLSGIADLVRKVRGAYYGLPGDQRSGQLMVTVSAACFVPKPCTPFQWRAQDDIQTLREKQRFLQEKLRIRGVKFNWHDSRTSFLEAVLARGDRRLSDVLYRAWQNGAKFDAWNEFFRFETWQDAFKSAGLDPAFYALRERLHSETLPWSHIRCGVGDAFLKKEDGKAKRAATTPDCREKCQRCGLEGACP